MRGPVVAQSLQHLMKPVTGVRDPVEDSGIELVIADDSCGAYRPVAGRAARLAKAIGEEYRERPVEAAAEPGIGGKLLHQRFLVEEKRKSFAARRNGGGGRGGIDERDFTDDLANAHPCKLSERQIGDREFSLEQKYQRVGLLAFVDQDIAVAEPLANARLRDPLHVGVAQQTKDVENLSHRQPSLGLSSINHGMHGSVGKVKQRCLLPASWTGAAAAAVRDDGSIHD